jgi:hypothetical protein
MKMYHSIDELHKKAKVLLEKTTEIHRLRYQLQKSNPQIEYMVDDAKAIAADIVNGPVDIRLEKCTFQATFGDLPRETVQEVLEMVDDAKAIAADIVNGPIDIRLEKSRA